MRPHSALGYQSPEEFVQSLAAGYGKDAGFARLGNASHFPHFPTASAAAHRSLQESGVVLQNPNPENVSLSLD